MVDADGFLVLPFEDVLRQPEPYLGTPVSLAGYLLVASYPQPAVSATPCPNVTPIGTPVVAPGLYLDGNGGLGAFQPVGTWPFLPLTYPPGAILAPAGYTHIPATATVVTGALTSRVRIVPCDPARTIRVVSLVPFRYPAGWSPTPAGTGTPAIPAR